MTSASETQKSNTWKWLVLATVIVGTFLGRLDQTIVNLALPKIINDFGISVSSAGWIATAYIIANAIFVPIWGKLGDTIGRKKVYVIGFVVFIIGSVLAGLSWNLGSMIVFRVIQAIAGSADYPTAMAILSVTFAPGKERAQALGIWSSAFAAASVFGPLLGGPLIDGFGWRSVFLINLPIGIIGMIMAMRYIHESVSEERPKGFDWGGAITLGVALSALVLVLDKGMDWGWLSLASMGMYAVLVLFLGWFIHIEKHSAAPIVDLKFFRNSVFVGTLFNNFIVFMSMMGGIFLIPIFAQTFLGYDATQSGYLFMPMAFAMVIAAAVGGKLAAKLDATKVIAWSTIGSAFGIFLFSYLDPRSGALAIIIPLSIMAFSMGFGMAQRTNAIASAVKPTEIGVASSILALARNIAGAFGIAIFGTMLAGITKQNVLDIAQSSHLHSHLPGDYAAFVSLITLKAQISAYDTIFVISAFVALVGGIMAFWVKIRNDAKPAEPIMAE